MYHGAPPRAPPTNTLPRPMTRGARGGCCSRRWRPGRRCAAGWPSPTPASPGPTRSTSRSSLRTGWCGAGAGVALEFREGLRTWVLPGMVAALLEVARGLGLSRPALYVPARQAGVRRGGCGHGLGHGAARATDGRRAARVRGGRHTLGARRAGHLLRTSRPLRAALRAAGDARARLGTARRRFPPRAGAGSLAPGSRGAAPAAEFADSAWRSSERGSPGDGGRRPPRSSSCCSPSRSSSGCWTG